MKRALLILGLIVVVVVGGLAALPFLIPTETYRGQIETRAGDALGREVAIEGDLRLSFVPRVALRAGDVRIAGDGPEDLAHIETLELDIALAPLLRGVLTVDRLVLVRPVVDLDLDAAGADPAAASEPGTGSSPPPVPLRDLAVGEVRIRDGTLRLYDAWGLRETLEAIDLALALESLDRPARLDGTVGLRGESVALTASLERPRDLLMGHGSDLALALQGGGAVAEFRGRLDSLDPPILAGGFSAETDELRRVAAWLAEPPPLEPGGLERAAISGELAFAGTRMLLENLRVSVDDIDGAGALTLELDGARPAASGEMRLGRIDMTVYRPLEGDAAANGSPGAPAQRTSGWSEAPILLPVPPGIDFDLDLELEELITPQARLGATRALLTVAPERLHVDLERAALYGGTATGRLLLEAMPDGPPRIEQELVLDGVALRPLLRDVMDVDRLDGRAEIRLSLTSRGVSQRQLVEALSGEGRVTLRDGAVLGIDLASVIQDAGRLVLDPGGTARRTEITRLDGSFTIRNGVLRNDDLTATAPLLRLSGEGEVDLGRRTIPGYRLLPRAAAAIGGDRPGFGVPVELSGPWDDLSVRVDLAGAVGRVVPGEVRDRLGDVGREIGEGLRELGRDEGVRELGDRLRGLFGR